jgi:hypothetical protein
MALGTSHQNATTGANFIPEIWSKEVQRATEANLTAAKLVKRFDGEMRMKGDILHVPKISNLSATAKTTETEVTFSSPTESKVDITIDKHYHIAILIEDILDAQSAYDLAEAYKEKMSYGLAKQMDTDVLALQSGLSQSVGTAGTPMDEDTLLAAIKLLDDADAPEDNRNFIGSTSAKRDLIKINRATSRDFVGDKAPLVRGWFTQWHGVNFYVSTNVPTSGGNPINLLLHKDALVLAVQKDITMKSDYVLEHLGMGYVAQTLYGVAEYRDAFGVKVLS